MVTVAHVTQHKSEDTYSTSSSSPTHTAASPQLYDSDYGFSTVSNINIFPNPHTTWLLDSAATCHHTGNRKLLHNIRKLTTARTTITGNGLSSYNEVGDAYINVNGTKIELENVVYIPKFKANLISLHVLTQLRYTINFEENQAKVWKDGKEVFTAYVNQGLYVIDTQQQHAYPTMHMQNALSNSSPTPITTDNDSELMYDLKLLHAKCGHMSYAKLHEIIKNDCVHGIKVKIKNAKKLYKSLLRLQQAECSGCLLGKMHRLPMTGVIDWNTRESMDLWVADILGPMKTDSIYGHKYVLILIDVHTRMIFVFVMHNKSEAQQLIINTIKQCQTQQNKKLKHFHSDGAKDILQNNEMKEFLNNNGTRCTITTTNTRNIMQS
jgi:hypothetical protein